MIKVVNLRTYQAVENEQLIKVDRSSILGNPFHINSTCTRDRVCDAYGQYLEDKVNHKSQNKDFILALKYIYDRALKTDIALGCWCAPLRCHADTIKDFITLAIIDRKDSSC